MTYNNNFLIITFTTDSLRRNFESEEERLARLAPLPAIEAAIHTANNFTFVDQENGFVTPYTICLVPRTRYVVLFLTASGVPLV